MQATDTGDLVAAIAEVVNEKLRKLHVALRPATDADLRTCGLDSMGIVQLVLDIEIRFDLAIPDAQITLDNFSTIDRIAALIGPMLHAAGNQREVLP
ncbi:MAG: phosphopantetheine-binding protein [Pseudomonadota bacterium]